MTGLMKGRVEGVKWKKKGGRWSLDKQKWEGEGSIYSNKVEQMVKGTTHTLSSSLTTLGTVIYCKRKLQLYLHHS